MGILKIKRGSSSSLNNLNLQVGELGVTLDNAKLYVGTEDGVQTVVGQEEIYVGESAPTTTDTKVWVNPNAISVIDLVYPVGSIYLSVNTINPSSLFGGTWVRMSSGYLYATEGDELDVSIGSNVTTAATGNTGSTTLTLAQTPSHGHDILSGAGANLPIMGYAPEDTSTEGYDRYYVKFDGVTHYPEQWMRAGNVGGGQGHTHTLNSHTHEIQPPGLKIAMWKRTA